MDQGTPEIDVDEAMARNLGILHRNLEEFAVDSYAPEDMLQASIAISAKRIADHLEMITFRMTEQNTGLNSLCTILKEAKEQHHIDAQSLTRAIFDLDHTVRANTGRELRINISKD